jgi:4-carboxymuconolactone decarboxylase
MSRLPDLTQAEMTPQQRRLHDAIAAKRHGHVRGPIAVWLRIPELAERCDAMTSYLRNGSVDRRLFELMTLIVSRHWTGQYVFATHSKTARDLGVDLQIIETIRTGGVPTFARADEQLVYDLTTALLVERDLPQALYDRAIATMGIDHTVELITAIGFYSGIGIVLNAFDVDAPNNERPLPV